MSSEDQKNTIKQYFQVLKDGKLEILEKILNPDCSYIDAGELKFTNREEIIDYLHEGLKPYTNFDVVIHDTIAEGDKAAVRCMFRLESKSEQTTLAVMGFFQFHENKIIKIWRNIVISDVQVMKSSI